MKMYIAPQAGIYSHIVTATMLAESFQVDPDPNHGVDAGESLIGKKKLEPLPMQNLMWGEE